RNREREKAPAAKFGGDFRGGATLLTCTCSAQLDIAKIAPDGHFFLFGFWWVLIMLYRCSSWFEVS
ncbi:hypothetical protein QQP08_005671, partial [Theobroma cacao]